MDVNKLLKKSLSCFCCFYVDVKFSTCENVPWMQSWEVEVLIHNNASYVHSAMENAFKKMNGMIMEMMVNGLLKASPWATILQ